MKTLLHIDVSPRADFSISRQLSRSAVEAWKQKHTDGKVVERDLSKTDLAFVDLDWITGAFSSVEQHTESHKKALLTSDLLIAELLSADLIVIGTPMYNFNVPAALKAWIDNIVRLNKTFSFSAAGLNGLAAGRRVLVIIAGGSSYEKGSPLESYDHQTPYMRTILGFIGITDVTFVMAGGTNRVATGEIDQATFLTPFLEEISSAV